MSDLGKVLNISWITPQMCVLFQSSMSEKRRFIDRLTVSIDNLHLNRVYKYDKLFHYTCRGNFLPLNSVIGAYAAQECIKSLTTTKTK